MTRWNARRAHRRPSAPASLDGRREATIERLEALADKYREGITHYLAICGQSYPNPGLLLLFPTPGQAPISQPLEREAVLDLARALCLHPAIEALGPLSPVLVVGEGQAVLLGSAITGLPMPPRGTA